MICEKTKLMYEGKAKKVYETNCDEFVIVYFKDDATAFNGVKKSTIKNKGILNNDITSILFDLLNKQGIKTHFVKKINQREQLCQKLEIFKLEVIVRNVIAGSIAKRLGIKEGTTTDHVIYELCYKNDEYGDPLINEDHAVALNLATKEELDYIRATALEINEILKTELDKEGIRLIDFKIEFGKDSKGEILLADEISPDTCRFWDKETNEKLDKDRFRCDLGSVEEAYIEIFNRIKSK